jgi:hypothetical protein
LNSIITKLGYPLKLGHPVTSMGYEQHADEPSLATEAHPFDQPSIQIGQAVGIEQTLGSGGVITTLFPIVMDDSPRL